MHRVGFVAACAVACMTSAVALADSPDPAAAEALFREGRERAEAGDWAKACPLFVDSNRLDFALGTSMNLAACEEHIGKLATAWERYSGLLEALPADDNRRAFVAESVARLERVVPKLTILLAAPWSTGRPSRATASSSEAPAWAWTFLPTRASIGSSWRRLAELRAATLSRSRLDSGSHCAPRRESRSPRPGGPVDRRERQAGRRAGFSAASAWARWPSARFSGFAHSRSDRRAMPFAPWASVATRRGSTITMQRSRRPWAPTSRWPSVLSRSRSVAIWSSRR